MKKNTFKVLFLIRRNQVNKDGKCAIMIKVTVDGEYERINSTLTIELELWDSAASKAIGRSSKIAEFNKRIEDMRHVLKEHYYDLLNRHGYVTAEMVKNAYTGVTAKEESLVTLYLQHLEDTKKLVGLSKADPTYKKYERMYRRVVEFMKNKYNITDIPLREIKPTFISDLEFFLRTEYKYSQNTVYKCMKFFKQVINKGIRAGLIFVDPFNGYRIAVERVDRGFLSEDELAKMMDKEFASKRLEQVRDIFIFACFTGLAYIDLAHLRVDNIQKMFDGRLWIVTHRQKTNTKVTVPLLPPALKILKKYEGQFLDGQLLPIIYYFIATPVEVRRAWLPMLTKGAICHGVMHGPADRRAYEKWLEESIYNRIVRESRSSLPLKGATVVEEVSTDEVADITAEVAEAPVPGVYESGDNTVTKVIETKPLFNLSSLLVEAAVEFDFDHEKTVMTAYRLYAKKLISYPVAFQNTIPGGICRLMKDNLKVLRHNVKWGNSVRNCIPSRRHNFRLGESEYNGMGIVTTGLHPTDLSRDEELLYNLIVKRVIEALATEDNKRRGRGKKRNNRTK